MAQLRTVCEVPNPEDPDNENEQYFYLLHWGMTAGKLSDGEGGMFMSSWTIAICQDIKTGQIHTFLPDYIKVIGYERFAEKVRDWRRSRE